MDISYVAPTYTADGKQIYTATVVFAGETYTDKKETAVDKLVLTHVAAAAADCETAGNIEYWYDRANEKYFTDVNGAHEITLADTVIPATGHSYGAPVWTWTALEDGSFGAAVTFTCDTCGEMTAVSAETEAETDEATYLADGKTVCTASAEFEGVTYTDSKTVIIPKLVFNSASVIIADAKATEGSTKITFNYKADLDPKSNDVAYGVLIKRKAGDVYAGARTAPARGLNRALPD